MSTEEDREEIAQLLNAHDPEGGSYMNDQDGNFDVSWWYPQADAILAAGFHRTPAPSDEVQALIAEGRDCGEFLADEQFYEYRLIARLTDALEAALGARE